jgi:hypothetical protein
MPAVTLYIFAAMMATAAVVSFGGLLLKRRREAPLRTYVRAQPVTFRAPVYIAEIKGTIMLIIHGEWIEISYNRKWFSTITGYEYFFKASDTSITMTRPSWGKGALLPVTFRNRVVTLTGRNLGKEIQLEMETGNHDDDIWNALISAGSVPVGPPPWETRR